MKAVRPSRIKNNFLKKLFHREIYGEIKECSSRSCQRLFQQLPHRLAFSLALVAPPSALAAGHIFLGFTKCGQFILSYTHTCDTDDHTLQMIHRYRLHWWLFTPYTQLRKVAEVMLFGDQDLQESVYENIYIAVCQWPRDLSRILVYGCSMDGGESASGPQTRRVYITITAVPSLANCSACIQVATSYEEEDMAERWNSCVRFSCLQHGVTVHTSFEMVPPFPRFMPTVQLKLEGHVVLNAGNFIHVLNVSLENMEKKTRENNCEYFNIVAFRNKEETSVVTGAPVCEDDSEDENSPPKSKTGAKVSPSATCSEKQPSCRNEGTASDNHATASTIGQAVINTNSGIEDDLYSDKLRISLRDKHNNSIDKDREWEILIGSVPKTSVSPAKKLKYDLSFHDPSVIPSSSECDIKSIDSDCSSISGDISNSKSGNSCRLPDDSETLSLYDETADSDDSTLCSRSADDSIENQNGLSKSVTVSVSAPVTSADDDLHISDATRVGGGTTSKIPSQQAEKEYEFIDEIIEARLEKLSVFRRRRLAEKKYEFSDENSENFPENYRIFRNQSRRLILNPSVSPRIRSFSVPITELSVELGESSELFRSVYEKLLSPSSGSASPNDVLRPINQNITSPVLSPRDDKWRDDLDKLERDKFGMQRWNSRESLTLYSPVPHSQQRLSDQNPHISQSGPGFAPQTLKCVVDIKRRYIEVDDELVSIITDIEDDELSSATGYHNALSLEVHGSGYTQMYMISKSKAEKLMVPGVLVRQVSLDVEQFCHETAQRLCNDAGKKYYFCHDYNVEIVDVCPTSGNVIALASVLVQAGNNKLKPSIAKPFRGVVGPHTVYRRLYKATATFVFNIDKKTYYLLDKEPLVEEDPYSLEVDSEDTFWDSDSCEGEWWVGARIAARQLRNQWAVPSDYFSSVKVMSNEALLKGKSLTHIMESYHHIALVLGSQN